MKKILVLYNLAEHLDKGVPTDLVCEQEITIIVPLVVKILSKRGYAVEALKADLNLWEELKRRRGKVDMVLNLAEAFGGGNANEPLVPAMLEGLGMPFTGASLSNMTFTLDKEKTKLVLVSYGVPVAPHVLFRTGKEQLNDLGFPLIVKPVREEASIGIYQDCVVGNEADLRKKVLYSLEKYRQPIMAERFIQGREISVGVIGNPSNLHVFPPLEFLFEEAGSEQEKIRSYKYKWGGKKEQMVRAELSNKVIGQLGEYSKICFEATDCRDYARMDYRLDPENRIYLLEVNYNPGIGPNDHGLNNTLTMMASFEGYSFGDLIERILITAMDRCGLIVSG